MYLLNRQQLERHVSDLNSRYLTIKNFSSRNLQHTSYYFRVLLVVMEMQLVMVFLLIIAHL